MQKFNNTCKSTYKINVFSFFYKIHGIIFTKVKGVKYEELSFNRVQRCSAQIALDIKDVRPDNQTAVITVASALAYLECTRHHVHSLHAAM